ncbi:MAG: spermidine synthase [Rhodopseudomonas sp.]|nr:spermidine synthase [Rhodopseudomonas sp.]
MIPWIHIDSARVPDGSELKLMRRGDEYSIKLAGNELMNSRLSGSEQALATLTCARLTTPKPRLLIGGLGMGFTLRAALEVLGPLAHIDVAEIVPQVVAWARGPMAELHGNSLSDPRVHVVEADVGALIAQAAVQPDMAYDAILLDVDNGPDGLSRPGNDRLYDHAGLGRTHAALRPRGVLAVWSSAPDRNFSKRLRQAGFAVDEQSVRAHGGRGSKSGGAKHTIWLATRD